MTTWCLECEGASDVLEESVETSAWPDPERDFLVRRLDCGHEESAPCFIQIA